VIVANRLLRRRRLHVEDFAKLLAIAIPVAGPGYRSKLLAGDSQQLSLIIYYSVSTITCGKTLRSFNDLEYDYRCFVSRTYCMHVHTIVRITCAKCLSNWKNRRRERPITNYAVNGN